MLNSFKSQTDIAAFKIGFNILAECRLVILSDNQFPSLVNFKIACQKIIMMVADRLDQMISGI